MEHTTINIGTEINLTDLLQSRLLIQANSGGGKSNTARVIMEEAFGKVPFIVFDREGEYFTLKEVLPDVIVIGGSFPDLPMALSAAALLPKEIVENRLSVVIDLSDLKSAQKHIYVRDFLDALLERPQTHWTPYLIFIEEAHFFAGQQDKGPAGISIKELMSSGRKKGYCGILITQRIAKINKDATAEVNNYMTGKTTQDLDMDRIAKDLGFNNAEQRSSLKNLKKGEFYVYGTSFNPESVHKVQVKLAKTRPPEAGGAVQIQTGKPTEKVLAALQKLNELPKEEKPVQQSIAIVDNNQVKILTEENKNLQFLLAEAADGKEFYRGLFHKMAAKLKDIRLFVANMDDVSEESKEMKEETKQPDFEISNKKAEIKSITKEIKSIASDKKLGKCAHAILVFLATYTDRSFTKAQIGISTGYSPGSGGFNNALSELNSKGLIIRDNNKIEAFADADFKSYIGDFTKKKYSIETYKSKLGKCEGEIYAVLLGNRSRWFTKEELAYQTETKYSYTSGGFNNALSTLNTLELIKRADGTVRLNPELLEL